jgi:hypothetical protein
MKSLVLAIGLSVSPLAAVANDFSPVRDKQAFVDLVNGKELRHRFYGIRLNVLDNGQVTGDAIGWDINGTWAWQDGYFCRELYWGGDLIPYNCQLVEIKNDLIRFTVDQGAGRSAAFRLQ